MDMTARCAPGYLPPGPRERLYRVNQAWEIPSRIVPHLQSRLASQDRGRRTPGFASTRDRPRSGVTARRLPLFVETRGVETTGRRAFGWFPPERQGPPPGPNHREAPPVAVPHQQFRAAAQTPGKRPPCLASMTDRAREAMTAPPSPSSEEALAVEIPGAPGVRRCPRGAPGKALLAGRHPCPSGGATRRPFASRPQTAATSPSAASENRQAKRPVAERQSRTVQLQIGGQTWLVRFQRVTVPRRGKKSSRNRRAARFCRKPAPPPPRLSAGAPIF